MRAIVIAAGEGRRLRPVTEHWPKPMLPIDGRAVIATLLRQLDEEGLSPVTVVTGHLAGQIEELLDGLGVSAVRQPEAKGSADAVRWALDDGAGLPAVVSAADSVFREGDLRGFRDGFLSSGAVGAIAYYPSSAEASIRVENGLVQRVVDSPGDLTPAPLWGLTGEIDLNDLPGPPFELSFAFQRAIDLGKRIAGIEVGRTRNITNPVDLVRENFPYLGGA